VIAAAWVARPLVSLAYFAGARLFALDPTRTESVTWIGPGNKPRARPINPALRPA
jgi:hypothetical protein